VRARFIVQLQYDGSMGGHGGTLTVQDSRGQASGEPGGSRHAGAALTSKGVAVFAAVLIGTSQVAVGGTVPDHYLKRGNLGKVTLIG